MGQVITRRRALFSLLALAGAGLSAVGCGPKGGGQSGGQHGSAEGIDFSARFAAYEAADEPNGDLAKVTWPAFVTRAGPEVRALYEFQITHGELMRYMPCFCGCGANGHRNNRDCYVRAVNPDGSVVFDPMAPT
jgi:hypothetical protein